MPLVLLIIIVWLKFQKKKQPLHLQSFFFKGFYLRVFGTFVITLLTEFYYKYGDTYHFYYNTVALRSLFVKDPVAWFKLLFSDPSSGSESVTKYLSIIDEYGIYTTSIFKTPENAALSKIASIFNLICFDSYLGVALFFGLLSFLGCWYIFKTFVHIYPGYEKQFAIFCLYIPSPWFWGCGILKDPVCVYALGILVYNFFVKDSTLIKRIIYISLGAIILLQIKIYIFYAFAIALPFGWFLFKFKRFSFGIKLLSIVIFLGALAASYSSIASSITESMNDIINDSQKYLELYSQNKEVGDATIIPTLDPSPLGFFKFCLEGLMTVYMKPFPWQINKVLYLFVILENMLIYYIIFMRIKMKPVNVKNNSIFFTYFCVVFAIVFGIVVGVNAFNLGTISRYRVPGLPFLFAGVFCLRLAKINRKSKLKITQP